jgi:2-polyprenyl-3-methyl-5-hydroxy-6-metoxy-1,4-benzoquinol methylase
VTPAAVRRQAQFIAAYLKHLEVPVRHILDMGCGTGMLLRALGRAFPKAGVRGVEFSDYLCETYGWMQGSVVDVDAGEGADLVVCNDVLGYLNDSECARALDNLARHTLGALYLGVLTREDLALCDPVRTDSAQTARPLAWYRRRLARAFMPVGGGLFLRRPENVTVWHLERG